MKRRAKKVRTIQVDGDIAYVPLTKGYTAIIDAEDAPLVEGYNWFAHVSKRTVYAQRNALRSEGPRRPVYLHRVISKPDPDEQVDHRDHNGLNNRKQNLRNCNGNENRINTQKRRANKSGFKGVSWHKRDRKWRATICTNGKYYHLGYFQDPREAHKAYCKASQTLHKEYGCTA